MRVLDLSYHPLDARSGGWLDLSRKDNHGTLHGGAKPYMIAPGVMGFEFDGNSGYVDCGSDDSLDAKDAITIGVWIYPKNAEGSYQGIIGKKGYSAYQVYVKSNQLGWDITNESNDRVFLFKGNIVNDEWHYIVTTYDSLLSSDQMKWYIDVALIGTANQTGKIRTSPNSLVIGWSQYGNEFFNGVIALSFIEKNRAWSPDEVRENYYRSPIYRMLRGLPHSMIYTKVPWKQTQGGIYVP